MKKIYSLNISRLNNNQHFTYMQLVVAACAIYAIISEQFSRLVAALRAAFEHEDYVFKRHDRNAINERVQGAETERCRSFRHLRDFIKTFLTCSIPAKIQAAEILLKVISMYGGGDIPSLKADERSSAIFNLVEDLEKDYPEQVAALGCTEMVAALKAANQAYLDAVTERAQYDSEFGMKMVAEARKQTDVAYHTLINAVNAAETVDVDGDLVPYIDYMNVNVRHYRMKIGQSLADMDGTSSSGSGSSGEEGSEDSENSELDPAENIKIVFKNQFNQPVHEVIVPVDYQMTEEEYPTPPEGTHWNFTLADLNLAIGMKNPGDTITVRAQANA